MEYDTVWINCENCPDRASAKTRSLWNPCERDFDIDDPDELSLYLSSVEIHALFQDVKDIFFRCTQCQFAFIAFPQIEDPDKIALRKEIDNDRRGRRKRKRKRKRSRTNP